MRLKTSRNLTIASLAVFILLNIGLTGLLTNWFRYNLSLETTVIVVPLLFVGAIVVYLHLFILKKKINNKLSIALPIFCTPVSIFLFVLLFKSAFGAFPSNIGSDDIERSEPRILSTPKGEIIYYLELWNTFSSSHSEYLIIKQSGQIKRFKISIFNEEIRGGYSRPGNPAEWATLTQTQWDHLYELNVHFSQGIQLFIDIKSDGVIEEHN